MHLATGSQWHSQHALKERCQLSSLERDLEGMAETSGGPEARAHLLTVSLGKSRGLSVSGFPPAVRQDWWNSVSCGGSR